MTEPSFYFDESVELAVSEQLALRGVDVVSARSLGTLGQPDIVHLRLATEMGRVLCTYDADFLRLASDGTPHAGIIYSARQQASIGDWVRELLALMGHVSAEDMVNQIVFLS